METEIKSNTYKELLKKAHKKLGFSGQEQVIKKLVREVIFPLIDRDTAEKYGIKPTKGVLLYGKPGTGKSYFAKNLEKFIPNSIVHIVNGPELQSNEYGETPKKLRELFKSAKNEPLKYHIFIFDEFDSLGRKRTNTVAHYEEKNDIINQLLVLIDGIESPSNILVVGITNRKEDLDDALIREGRFETHIEVPNCDALGRAEILEILLNQLGDNWLIEEVNPKSWGDTLEGYSPAGVKKFVEEVQRRALSESENGNCFASRAKIRLTNEIFQEVYADLEAEQRAKPDIILYYKHFKSAAFFLTLVAAQTLARYLCHEVFAWF